MENILYLFSWVKDVSIALLFDIPEVLYLVQYSSSSMAHFLF
jgi:hypothetical protein